MGPKTNNKVLLNRSSLNSRLTKCSVDTNEQLNNILVPLDGEQLYSCCAIILFCPVHKNLAISMEGKGPWLPTTILKEDETWINEANEGLKQILSQADMKNIQFGKIAIIDILRLQLPDIQSFLTRIICLVKIRKSESGDPNCCKSGKKIVWIGINDIINNKMADCWGPEPIIFSNQLFQIRVGVKFIREFTVDDAMTYLPQDPPGNDEEKLLKSTQFTAKIILKLYEIFLQCCYPSEYMVYPSFNYFMATIGWQRTDVRLQAIFRAFNYQQKGYLSFQEFLIGLSAMDPLAEHSGAPGRIRYGHIFRYYDSNNDGYLDFQDIYRMTSDIWTGKETVPIQEIINNETISRMEAAGLKKNELLSLPTFLKIAGGLIFTGTSVLFRSPIQTIKLTMAKEKDDQVKFSSGSSSGIWRRNYKGICFGCRDNKYKHASHTVKLNLNGRICDPIPITEADGDINFSTDDGLTEKLRVFSRLTVFNPNSFSNYTLDAIRQYDIAIFRSKNKQVDELNWNTTDKKILNALGSIWTKAEALFTEEPRCIQVQSPTFVFGDIHGNLRDLLSYERLFWKTGPVIAHSNFLFLGDYVDRGDFGVECVAYLFSLKILAPQKYILCRGNHEIRSIQRAFTFRNECVAKYGPQLGLQIWESINQVFDRMPLCAVVDHNIFCAHGGIPMSAVKLEDLLKIPSPLKEPERESSAAWEIMWNDPMNPGEFKELADAMKINDQIKRGFIVNLKRGTAYSYTSEAVDHFLDTNRLSYIIRAHEVVPHGFKYHMNGKVVTIFSCSYYCGGSNEAACIFLDDEKLRVIRIKTIV